MAKKALITVDGVYHKIKKGFVTVDGVYKKIKKAFISIGGVWRPFWSGGEIVYYGQYDLSELSPTAAFSNAPHGTIGDNFVFDVTTSSNQDARWAGCYSKSLVFSVLTGSTMRRTGAQGASNDNYLLIGGGSYQTNHYDSVETFNKSLTRGSAPNLTRTGGFRAAGNFGEYAVFANGTTQGGSATYWTEVDFYNNDLTKSTSTSLRTSKTDGARTKTHFVVAGGTNYDGYRNTVAGFSSDFVCHTPTTGLSQKRISLGAATVGDGDYVIFAGGTRSSDAAKVADVDAFNTDLTRTVATSLQQARTDLINSCVTLGGYAIIAGGEISQNSTTANSNIVDIYSPELVRTVGQKLKTARRQHISGTVGDYAIFAGGVNLCDAEVYALV